VESNLGVRGKIEYQLANNTGNKFVTKVIILFWRISLFMETREQLGKINILLNQLNMCLCHEESNY